MRFKVMIDKFDERWQDRTPIKNVVDRLNVLQKLEDHIFAKVGISGVVWWGDSVSVGLRRSIGLGSLSWTVGLWGL